MDALVAPTLVGVDLASGPDQTVATVINADGTHRHVPASEFYKTLAEDIRDEAERHRRAFVHATRTKGPLSMEQAAKLCAKMRGETPAKQVDAAAMVAVGRHVMPADEAPKGIGSVMDEALFSSITEPNAVFISLDEAKETWPDATPPMLAEGNVLVIHPAMEADLRRDGSQAKRPPKRDRAAYMRGYRAIKRAEKAATPGDK
ncbi:MAG: hypothetical protein GC182_08950 [Rhodopseudomonas sp.]|nr:hypothetical protein [Rhodopseudomonas sp.]